MVNKLFIGGAKAVAAAGTAEQLSATSFYVDSLIIQANPTNTGYVYVGDSTAASGTGYVLAAEDVLTIGGNDRRGGNDQFDIADIYLDVSVGGEGIRWLYIKQS